MSNVNNHPGCEHDGEEVGVDAVGLYQTDKEHEE